MQFSILLLMFNVGQYVEDRELELNSSCVGFLWPIELGSVNSLSSIYFSLFWVFLLENISQMNG